MICAWMLSSSTGNSSPCADGIEHPVDIVMRLDDGLVAGADLVGEAQLPVAATRQKRKGQRAALTGDGDGLGPAALRQQWVFRIVEHRAGRRDQWPERVDQ